jgi:hypothetical protein
MDLPFHCYTCGYRKLIDNCPVGVRITVVGHVRILTPLESLDDVLKTNHNIKINRKKQKLLFAPKILKILIL